MDSPRSERRVDLVVSAQLSRPRLVERLRAGRVATIVAPGGYGKSALLNELSQSAADAVALTQLTGPVDEPAAMLALVRRAVRSAGAGAASDALELPEALANEDGGHAFAQVLGQLLAQRSDPLLLIVDEAQWASAEALRALDTLARVVDRPHGLVIAGRRLANTVKAAATGAAVELDANALAFTADEVVELAALVGWPIDQSLAALVAEETRGWPAAVSLALQARVATRGALRQGIAGLLDASMAAASSETRIAAARAAHLPRLSRPIVDEALGPGTFDRLADAGVPFSLVTGRWLAMPDPVRDVLLARAPLPPEAAVSAARGYINAGEMSLAVSFLAQRQEYDSLAGLLEELPWQELQVLASAEQRVIVSMMPDDVIDRHPRLILAMVRGAETAAQVEWWSWLVERARQSLGPHADPIVRREVETERAVLASKIGPFDGVLDLCKRILAETAPSEVVTRSRVLASMGRTRAHARDPNQLTRAAEELAESAALARLTGDSEGLASTLIALGYAIQYEEGDLQAAASNLREAEAAATGSARQRATALSFLAETLVYFGELDGAETALREMTAIGRRLLDQRLLGYAAWIQASIAAHRGDGDAVEVWLVQAERHPGDWFDHLTGIEFLADGVDYLGRANRGEAAERYLRRVEERCLQSDRPEAADIFLVARAIHLGRLGDPIAAEPELRAVLQSEQLPRREVWHINLLRGFAALRRNDDAEAGRLAARAFEEAAALGHPNLPFFHEPEIANRLRELAQRSGSTAAVTAARMEPRLRLRLLGDFGLTADGLAVEVPPGRTATLVKLLALANGPVTVDAAIEVLWEEMAPEIGRTRLRNIIWRVNSVAGDVIVRAEDSLTLNPLISVDAREFEATARGALRGAKGSDGMLARQALAMYAGELLPADRYADYTVAARERLSMLQLELLDQLAEQAGRTGDIDEALRLYQEAIAAAPLDEHRYEQSIALALANRRHERASRLMQQARVVLEELGVGPSPALAGLMRELGAPGSGD